MCIIRKFTDWIHLLDSKEISEESSNIEITKASKALQYFQGELQSKETLVPTAKLPGASW